MRIMDGFYTWTKGEVCRIGNYFVTREFNCHCKYTECQEQKVSVELVTKLDEVRGESGSPITVKSGFRCRAHQVDLTNDPKLETVAHSTHEKGIAADIRMNLNGARLLLDKHFRAIGEAKTWFHVDLRNDKTRYWKYK